MGFRTRRSGDGGSGWLGWLGFESFDGIKMSREAEREGAELQFVGNACKWRNGAEVRILSRL